MEKSVEAFADMVFRLESEVREKLYIVGQAIDEIKMLENLLEDYG